MINVDIVVAVLGVIVVLVVGGIVFVSSKDQGSGWDDDDYSGWG